MTVIEVSDDTPRWLQIALQKRNTRDALIEDFVRHHSVLINQNDPVSIFLPRSPANSLIKPFQISHANGQGLVATRQPTVSDSVDEIVFGISSGAVTATALCISYISR